MRIGEIDQRCVAPTNELPKLTPQEAASRTWVPDEKTWAAIRKHAAARPATITITGFSDAKARHAVSRGRVVIQISKDPVGAPIFYRDVPLMPSELEKGVIKPLAGERGAADRLAAAQRRRAAQPAADGGPSHLRQLPLVLARRQDAGHGSGRAAERQGHVCHRRRRAADVHPQRGRDRVEFLPRPAGGADAGRLHVAGLARRAATS